MTTTATEDFRIGDRVTLPGEARFPGVWIVKKINPVNIRLEQNGRLLSAHPSYLRKAEGDEPVDKLPARQSWSPRSGSRRTSPRARWFVSPTKRGSTWSSSTAETAPM